MPSPLLPLPSRPELARRIPRCVLGLLLCGLGIALSVRSELGLGPWDVLHQGIGTRLGLPLGTVGILVGLVVLLAWIPLRERLGLGTLLNTVLVGSAIDVFLTMVPTLHGLAVRWLALAAGMALLAVGSGLYIGAGLGAGPRDGMMVGLHRRGWTVRRARTLIELGVLALGWMLGGTIGVGTVAVAFAVGPMVHVTIGWFALPPLRAPEAVAVPGR